MMKPGLTRIGYSLGISALLGAMIYFFAANWGGMERLEKVALSWGLVAVLYAAAYGVRKIALLNGQQHFLSKLLLFAGCIAFGAAVALLDQIYNAHADSYRLFLIWSVPAIGFALVTRLQAFMLLSYILVHVGLWLFFFPTMMYKVYAEGEQALIYVLFALLNLLVFWLARTIASTSRILQVISLLGFHAALLLVSNSLVLEELGPWFNALHAPLLALGIWYFSARKLDRTLLAWSALAVSAFLCTKFVELTIWHASKLFFIFGLLFVAALLTANVLFFRYMQTLRAPGEAGEEEGKTGGDEGKGALAARIVSTTITVVGVFIATISLIGLVALLAGDVFDHALFTLALLLILPMLLWRKLQYTIRYTILITGYAAGTVSTVNQDQVGITLAMLGLIVAGWALVGSRGVRWLLYVLFNLHLCFTWGQMMDELNWASLVLVMLAVNLLLHGSALFIGRGGNPRWRQLQLGSLTGVFIYFFWLTFLDPIFPYAYTLFNLFYAIVVTALVFWFFHRDRTTEAYISLGFWFAFLVYKYYDLLWSLLHKSWTLAIAGVLLLIVTYLATSRWGEQTSGSEVQALGKRRIAMLVLLILLQFVWLGQQSWSAERILAQGTQVKLELEPLDPRSLLQGDYVQLNYTISQPEEEDPTGSWEPLREQGRIRVVLAPDADGIHQFVRFAGEDEELSEGEVIINGRTDGYRTVYYGIETYFVPEGTGLEVESTAKYAYVRVSARGDALIERLTEE